MCVASPRRNDHEVVCVSDEKEAVTSSLEQRARLIAVKNANDDLSNDFTGTEGVAENTLTPTILLLANPSLLLSFQLPTAVFHPRSLFPVSVFTIYPLFGLPLMRN